MIKIWGIKKKGEIEKMRKIRKIKKIQKIRVE